MKIVKVNCVTTTNEQNIPTCIKTFEKGFITLCAMTTDIFKLGALDADKTAFLLCDMQDGFRSDIQNFDDIVKVINKMLPSSQLLHIPVYASEHTPNIYGGTSRDVHIDHLDNVYVYEKSSFSMHTPELQARMKMDIPGLKSIVIFGVEAHICVEQTIVDFLKENIAVHVLVDAVSSRSLLDRWFALKRFETMGCYLSTAECVLYKLLKGTAHHFHDEVAQYITEAAADQFGDLPK